MRPLSELLWGKNAKFTYLFVAAVLLLFTSLGSHEIWTQEHRWADIVSAMFYSNDFLHPSLEGNDYYDKPLLSYWLIAGFSALFGHLSTWTLRLPSALAGLLAIGSIYRLGCNLKDKQLGLLAGWLLLTTFYFVFWARTSSADMLNLAGTLFAVSWYFEKRNDPRFLNYVIFFLILAVTALCKGLVGPVVAVLAILPDLILQNRWKKYLRFSVLFAIVPAAIIYSLPFWASTQFGLNTHNENGLYLVYRENILRYFHPFDHKDPIYTYFIYLPIYLLPWTFFFIPALFYLKSCWKMMSVNSKWIVWATLLLFLFFTLSGSRRSYYVLPIVPFAILMTADWILAGTRRNSLAGRVTGIFFILLFFNFAILQPLYYSQRGVNRFVTALKKEAVLIRPWSEWQFVMLDPESKVRFYLELPPTVKNYNIIGKRNQQTQASLLQAWPILKTRSNNIIFITRQQYEPLLRPLLKNYEIVEIPPSAMEKILKINRASAPVAFIPK